MKKKLARRHISNSPTSKGRNMGMHTYVEGFKPPGDLWKKMKAVWDACEDAKLSKPEAVVEFFNGEAPDPAGVRMDQKDLENCGCVVDYKHEARDGFEVSLEKIPHGVTIIRFVNSY
jgi:hypothetical protein